MSKRKFVVQVLVVLACIFWLSASTILAQEPCEADLNCDGMVDPADIPLFKEDYPRSPWQGEPCPSFNPRCIPATVPKTGQTTCYDSLGTPRSCTGTGEDGEYRMGVEWPNPRFTDNEDGTVTDNLTGLIWLKDANCASFSAPESWFDALLDCNGLASGTCGLLDGSSTGDWRLPNRNELNSLIHIGFYNPALPDTAGTGQWSEGDPFTNVQSSYYWSSTPLPIPAAPGACACPMASCSTSI